MVKFVNILPTNTTNAAKYISRFNFCPKYVNTIESMLLQKNPVMKIVKSKFFFNTDVMPPNTESNAATTSIAKNIEYVYGITGAFIPINAPIIHPIIIAITIILQSP